MISNFHIKDLKEDEVSPHTSRNCSCGGNMRLICLKELSLPKVLGLVYSVEYMCGKCFARLSWLEIEGKVVANSIKSLSFEEACLEKEKENGKKKENG